MTLALVVITSGLALFLFGHWPIRRLMRRSGDPRVAIVSWLIALTAAPGMLIGGIAILLLPGHAGLTGLARSAGGCLIHLANEETPTREEVTGLVGLLLLVVGTARIVVVAAQFTRRRRQQLDHHRFLVALASRPATNRPDGRPIHLLDHRRPMAYSVGGASGLVVVSRGLQDALTPGAFAAAIAHEQAHLKGHHHLLLAAVDILAAAIPIAPLLRHAPNDLRVLVEYAADTEAARRWGAPAVRNAVLAVAGSTVPRCALSMAGGPVADRLARLQGPVEQRSTLHRLLRCGVAGATTALGPLLVTATALLVVACPTA